MKKVVINSLKITQVILLCLFSLSLSAQKIYFCRGYSEMGEPKGSSDTWPFSEKGTELVFLYNNGRTTFDFAAIFFLVEEKNTKETDKVEMKVYQNKSWEAKKYTFKKPGEYNVAVFGNNNIVLASGFVKIVAPEVKKVEVVKEIKAEENKELVKEEIKEKVVEMTAEKVEVVAEKTEKVEQEKISEKINILDTKEAKEVLYYDDIKVVFCEQLKEGKIVNEKTNFKMSDLGAYVEVVLQSGKPLNTDAITVDIWKKEKESNSYTEHAHEEEIKLSTKNKQVNFHHSFFKPGEYKISFFNDDSVWMTTGYVSITQ